MKRRDVLKLGAVAAGVGVGVPGCGLPRMLGELQGAEGGAAFNAMLDEQLGHLAKPGLLQRLVGEITKTPMSAAAHAKVEAHDARFRAMLGTLLISQGFRDLPEVTQREQSVQDRMWSHMEQLGTTVFAVRDQLAALGPEERKKTKDVLKQQPALPMALAEALDGRSARAGLSRKRRGQLRSMMGQAAFRLKNGDPGVLFDEVVGKVERMHASTPNDALTLELGRKLGEQAFWREQHLRFDATPPPFGPSPTPPPPAPPAPPAPPPTAPPGATPATGEPPPPPPPTALPSPTDAPLIAPPHQRPVQDPDAPPPRPPAAYVPTAPTAAMYPQPDHPGSTGLRVGAYMLGIGVAVGLGSALLLAAGSGAEILGLFGMTAAVLSVAIGLLVLLVSALIYATA